MKGTDPITYAYKLGDRTITCTRRHVGTAYARNGNVGNPSEYFVWEARLDGEYVVGNQPRRSSAYEYARAQALGIPYSEGVGENMRGCRNVRAYTTVADEMKQNFVSRQRSPKTMREAMSAKPDPATDNGYGPRAVND